MDIDTKPNLTQSEFDAHLKYVHTYALTCYTVIVNDLMVDLLLDKIYQAAQQ